MIFACVCEDLFLGSLFCTFSLYIHFHSAKNLKFCPDVVVHASSLSTQEALEQKDCCTFDANLDYIVNSSPARAT